MNMGAVLGMGGTILLFLVIALGLYGCPQYNVYTSRLSGEADLANAEYSRKVQVADAQGKLDAATLLAQVEVARAKGVAQANKIIGDSLKDNPEYLKYLWITDVGGKQSPTVIYMPTNSYLPTMLEAGAGLKAHP